MSAPENYSGQNVLISYIKTRSSNLSYRGFLNSNRDTIVTSISSADTCNSLDNKWTFHFLKEAESRLEQKIFIALKNKVKTEHSQRAKDLQTYWQGVIAEQRKNIKRKRTVTEDDKEKNLEQSLIKRLRSVITLNCLVQGNAFTNAFAIDIDSSKLISCLKEAIKAKKSEFDNFPADKLKLWNVEIPNNHDDQLRNLSLQVQDELLATRKILKYFSTTPAKEHIHIIVSSANIDSLSTGEYWKKQCRILGSKKVKTVFGKVVDDALRVALAHESLIAGNVIPFTKIIKTFLLTRSRMSLSSANEPVLQAIVESLLPLKYYIPELSLVMDSTKLRGSGRFGFSDVFVLSETGENNVCLELKYVSLVGLTEGNWKNIDANELEKLDQALEKEDEGSLLSRSYTYWSKENRKENQTTIGETLNGGMNQLKSYMSIISNGKPENYSDSGLFDDRVRITTSDPPNKIQGFVILVIGFRSILWKQIENISSKYKYSKI